MASKYFEEIGGSKRATTTSLLFIVVVARRANLEFLDHKNCNSVAFFSLQSNGSELM